MPLALLVNVPASALTTGDETGFFGSANDGTEGAAQFSVTEACTLSAIRTNIISGGSGTNNFQSRVNGGNGSILATRSGAGVAEDLVNDDSLSIADLINIAYTDTGSNSTCSWITALMEMSSGHGWFQAAANYAGVVFDIASSTRFIALAGGLLNDGDTAEADAQFKVRGADTITAFQVNVTANARTNDTVLKLRLNGGDVAGTTITYGAGATGIQVVTGLSVAVSDGDLLCASITTLTGVEDFTATLVGATLKSSTNKQDIVFATRSLAGSSALARAASATEHFFPIGGLLGSLTAATEAQSRIRPGFSGVASNVRIYLAANSYGADAPMTLYKNSVSAIVLTLTAGGGAALYENTSDTVTFNATDEFSFGIVGGTSGSITIKTGGLTLSPTTGALAGSSTLTFDDGASVMVGTGALAGAGTLAFAPSGTMVGAAPAGDIEGTSTLTLTPGGTMAGDGALDGDAVLTFTPVGALAGAGALDGDAVLTFAPTGTMVGAGALAGAGIVTFAPTATVLAAGSLAGSSLVTFTPQAVMDGAGALAGSSLLAFAPIAALAGDGVLAGSSLVAFSLDGTLDLPDGAMQGSSVLTFTPAGTMAAFGDLSGISSLSFTPQGVLLADGALAGPSVLAFLNTGTLAGTGALAGSGTVAFDPTGTIISAVEGDIAGAITLSFAVSGTLDFGHQPRDSFVPGGRAMFIPPARDSFIPGARGTFKPS